MLSLNRRALLAALGAAALPRPALAADPWAAKPPSEWTEKDLLRLMSDSPWARSVSLPDPRSSGASSGGGGGRGRRSGGSGMDASDSSGIGGSDMGAASSSGIGGGGGGGGRGGRGGRGEGGGMEGGGTPSIPVMIRWQSSRPIKIATIRGRMGAEADTNPKAKDLIAREEPDYIVAVIFPPQLRPGGRRPGAPDQKTPDTSAQADALKEHVSLSVKGRDSLHPTSVILPNETNIAFIFRFAKTPPITLEDKEVEFEMTHGPFHLKRKFKLKEMVYEGRLEL
jgi:hypothetical protein